MKCEKHNIDLECMAGRSAHYSNWYCPKCEQDTEAKTEIIASVPSMGEVVNKAAKHLPKGYKVLIEVEHEGFDVRLEWPNGSSKSVDGGDGGIIGDVNEAICIANGFSS